MNKKTISLVAMIVSALIFLCGLLVIFGAFGGNTSYASGTYLYDSGYAAFGTDFYTYVSNNAAEAATGARTAANNLDKMADLMKAFCGIVLMGFGLLSLCRNAITWIEAKAEGTVYAAAPAPAAPAYETPGAPAYEASCAPVAEEPTVLFCKNCGNTLKPGQVFCGNCGTSIR